MVCTDFQFHELIDLHKFYLQLLLTSTSFYLGIVGGVLAYIAKTGMPEQRTRLALAIPTLLSFAASVGFTGGFFKLLELKDWVSVCRGKYGWAPHAEILPPLSLVFAAVAVLVSIALIAILVRPSRFLGAQEVTPE